MKNKILLTVLSMILLTISVTGAVIEVWHDDMEWLWLTGVLASAGLGLYMVFTDRVEHPAFAISLLSLILALGILMFGSMYRDSKLAAEAEAGDEMAMERLEKLSEEKADLRVYELDEGDIITVIARDFEVLADRCSQFKEEGYSYSGTPQAVPYVTGRHTSTTFYWYQSMTR